MRLWQHNRVRVQYYSSLSATTCGRHPWWLQLSGSIWDTRTKLSHLYLSRLSGSSVTWLQDAEKWHDWPALPVCQRRSERSTESVCICVWGSIDTTDKSYHSVIGPLAEKWQSTSQPLEARWWWSWLVAHLLAPSNGPNITTSQWAKH